VLAVLDADRRVVLVGDVLDQDSAEGDVEEL
jgi:hypothetical protein